MEIIEVLPFSSIEFLRRQLSGCHLGILGDTTVEIHTNFAARYLESLGKYRDAYAQNENYYQCFDDWRTTNRRSRKFYKFLLLNRVAD